MNKHAYLSILKRIISMLLCFCLLSTSVDLSSLTAYAADEDIESYNLVLVRANGEYVDLTAPKIGEGAESYFDFDQAIGVPYGESISFALRINGEIRDVNDLKVHLTNNTGVDEYGDLDLRDAYHIEGSVNNITSDNYYVLYESSQLDITEIAQSGYVIPAIMKIEKGQLGAPEDLELGDTDGVISAHWNQVGTSKEGYSLVDGTNVKYSFKLYKSTAADPIYTTEADLASVDLTSVITSSGNGYGDYYFEVLSNTDNTNYLSSETSRSGTYEYRDRTAPVIEAYSSEKVNGITYLKASLSDADTKVTHYAFAPSSVNITKDYSGWISLPETTEDPVEVKAQIDDLPAGIISVYAMDLHGNISKADAFGSESAYISKLKLKGEYINNTRTDSTVSVLGEEAVTLPTADDMLRTGNSFYGWFTSEQPADSDKPITVITPGTDSWTKGSELELYAKWDNQNVEFSNDLESSYSKTYDGEPQLLAASLNNRVTFDSVEWEWYYSADGSDGSYAIIADGSNIDISADKRSSTLSATNCKDSGYYYAKAHVKVGEGEDATTTTKDTNKAHVIIDKKSVEVIIKDITVSFLSEIPEAAYKLEEKTDSSSTSFIGEDNIDNTFVYGSENFITDYNAGDAVKSGGYTLSMKSKPQADNYEISTLPAAGKVIVEPLDISDKEVSITLDRDSFVYDGTEKKPVATAVTVVIDNNNHILSQEDYVVSYEDNIHANLDTTAVVLRFKGNFKGSASKHFAIGRGEYTTKTTMEGWKYGETPKEPGLTTIQGEGASDAITYYYLEISDADAAGKTDDELKESFESYKQSHAANIKNVKPSDAGRYYVWGVIAPTANYGEITASPEVFAIAKRSITLTADSNTWKYDGNEHSQSTYVQTGEGFAPTEGFHSVTVSGAITNVGTENNVIEYRLSSATKERNYDINLVPGTLTIESTVLTNPSTFAWMSTPGGLGWVAITRENLTVKYEVKLYRAQLDADGKAATDDKGMVIFDNEPVSTQLVDSTRVSFLEAIHGDSTENPYAYSATIRVIPEDNANYTASEESAKIPVKYTTKVTLSKVPEDKGVDTVSITSESQNLDEAAESIIVVDNEPFTIHVATLTGYSVSDSKINIVNDGNREVTKSDYSSLHGSVVRISNSAKAGAITITVRSNDNLPYRTHYQESTEADNSAVLIDFTINDAVGLSAYQFVKMNNETDTPAYNANNWNDIANNLKTFSHQERITEEGVYYLFYKDTGNNIVHVAEPTVVYSIIFDKNAEDAAGSMPPLFKLKGQTIVIPNNTFTYSGHTFTNWTGATGIYSNGGSYVVNSNDTLHANWTDKSVSYTVRYYYQQIKSINEDGKAVLEYVEDEALKTDYSAGYGTKVSYNNPAIINNKLGYHQTDNPAGEEFTTSPYPTEISLTDEHTDIALYYNLDSYPLTYTYKDHEGNNQTKVFNLYYGQPIPTYPIPVQTGYDFVGWDWGELVSKPDTMPNNAINVSGYFKAQSVQFKVYYYEQNMNQAPSNKENLYLEKSFSLNESLTETINSEFGKKILATINSAPEETPDNTDVVAARRLDGFTPVAVKVFYGDPETAMNESFDDIISKVDDKYRYEEDTTHNVYKALSESEKADGIPDGPTSVCFYYTRNTYSLTLDVFKDARENGNYLFGHHFSEDNAAWTFPYGYVFEAEGSDNKADESDNTSFKASYFETYGYESEEMVTIGSRVISEAWTRRWPSEGEHIVPREKYYLAEFVDWSSGKERPKTMPAGDVVVTREYASAETAKYTIEVYTEAVEKEDTTVSIGGEDVTVQMWKAKGKYNKAISYDYIDEVGKKVILVDTMPEDSAKEANAHYILIKDLMGGIAGSSNYEHNPAHDPAELLNNNADKEILSGYIIENSHTTEVGEDDGSVLKLRINLVRREYTAWIRYYKNHSSEEGKEDNKLIGYTKVKQKWGTSYFVDPLIYFGADTTTAPTYDERDIYEGALPYKVATIHNNDLAAYDYKNNKYIVSYSGYRQLPTSKTHSNPSGKYSNLKDAVRKDNDYVYQYNLHNAPAQMFIMGGTNSDSGEDIWATWNTETGKLEGNKDLYNYMNVYYSEQDLDKHFVLQLTYEEKDTAEYRNLVPSEASAEKAVDAAGNAVDIRGFNIVAANRADIFVSNAGGKEVPDEFRDYPGLYYQPGVENGFKYTYEKGGDGKDKLREGYEEITVPYITTVKNASGEPEEKVTDGTFYIYKNADGSYAKYLFTVDDRNQFYNGNRLSYNYTYTSNADYVHNSHGQAYVGRDVFTAEGNRPTASRIDEINNGNASVYQNGKAVENGAIDLITDGKVNNSIAYYYNTANYYALTFHYNGQACTSACGKHHQYSYNEPVTSFNCTFFTVPNGYHIEWYFDAAHTRPVSAFTITESRDIYGVLERNPVENIDYAYYKLPDKDANVKVEYITKENLSDYSFTDRTVKIDASKDFSVTNIDNSKSKSALTGEGFEYVRQVVTVAYGNNNHFDGIREEYYYNGMLVMAKTPHYTGTFTEFNVDYTKYGPGGEYGVEGFTYDEANTKNKTKAYVSNSPVDLYSYFNRNNYRISIERNNVKDENIEFTTKTYGSLLTVADPSRPGYIFKGWKLLKAEDDDTRTEKQFIEDNSDSQISLRMPAYNAILSAQWEPDVIDFRLTHLFQDDNKQYRDDVLKEIVEKASSGESTSITLNGIANTEAKKVDLGSNAVAFIHTKNIADPEEGGVKSVSYYYYGYADWKDSAYTVTTANLLGAVSSFNGIKSEDVLKIDDVIIKDVGSIFGFSVANYTYEHETTSYPDTEETFAAYIDAGVTLFYERSSSIHIRAIGRPLDSGESSGATISGSGDRYFGEATSLIATMQPSGYDFLGWFKASEVLKNYPEEGVYEGDLTSLELVDDLADKLESKVVEPESTLTTYEFAAHASMDYVGITKPSQAAIPSIVISSPRTEDYEYNYANDAKNILTTTVTWPEGAGNSNSIKNYQWYRYYVDMKNMDPDERSRFENQDLSLLPLESFEMLPDTNSGTYLFPIGHDAGYYVYRCVANIERKDNGRTGEAYGSYLVRVNPNSSYYLHESSEYTYSVDEEDASKAKEHTYTETFFYGTENNTAISHYYSESSIPENITAEEVGRRLALKEGNPEKIYTENIKYKDVAVDLTAEAKPVIPHVVYYLHLSEDKNYVSLAGSEKLTINPAEVTVEGVRPFVKYYDADTKIQGASYDDAATADTNESVRYIENQAHDSDYKRLQLGTDLSNGQSYYRIDGILSCDSNLKIVLNFDASYNNKHVNGATDISFSKLWVAVDELNRVTNDYNYRFTNQDSFGLSGMIKPYPLAIKWMPKETSDPNGNYKDSDYAYNYNGKIQNPAVTVVDEHAPNNNDDFIIEVRNGQKNVGEYNANAEIIENTELSDEVSYEPADYTFTLSRRSYRIIGRYLKVVPKNITKVYTGKSLTMLKDDTHDEFSFFTKESENDTWREFTLPEYGNAGGENFYVEATSSYVNAGVYSEIGTANLRIINSEGANINDNYYITHGTGTLTILPAPVVVEGITGVNKSYDGSTAADLNLENISFLRIKTDEQGNILQTDGNVEKLAGLYGTDRLELDSTKLSGSFVTASAGNDKQVNITYNNSGAASNGSGGALIGASKDNYKLVGAGASYSQPSTTANILSETVLTAHISNLSFTYGENKSFTNENISFTGFKGTDNESNSVISDADHKANFIIKRKVLNEGEEELETVTDNGNDAGVMSKLNAGEYLVYAAVKTDGVANELIGVESNNYTICWDAAPAKLTITKRPLGVAAKEEHPVITKEYDGSTDVTAKIAEATDGTPVYYKFTAVEGMQASGIVDRDELSIGSYSASYDSKDATVAAGSGTTASGASKVIVSDIALSGDKSDNYELKNTGIDLKGEIGPKKLTITVDNISTVYGNRIPDVSYTVEGAIESEKADIEAAVSANTVISCEYTNDANSDKRHVGAYQLKVTGQYTNHNYNVVYKDGNHAEATSTERGFGYLNVLKRTVFYRPDDTLVRYGVKNPAEEIKSGQFIAGEDTAVTGWVYGEEIGDVVNGFDASSIGYSCIETGDTQVSNTTVPGIYDINPTGVEGALESQDYEFKNAIGRLTIAKYYIAIENVEALGKIYDGTVTVPDKNIVRNIDQIANYDGLRFYYYEGTEQINGLTAKELVTEYSEDYVNKLMESIAITAEYADKGVSDNSKVNVYITLKDGTYLAERYELLTAANKSEAIANGQGTITEASIITQIETNAFILGSNGEKIYRAIMPRSLTLYPTDEVIHYGEAIEVTTDLNKDNAFGYSVIKDKRGESENEIIGFAGTGSNLENVNTIGFSLNSTVKKDSIDYTVGADIGEYTIDISSSTVDASKSKNYTVGYAAGRLSVIANTFPAPANIEWDDSSKPGTIRWDKVEDIAWVAVDHYELQLFKEGTDEAIATYNTDNAAVTSYDLSSKLREEGNGHYSVKVRAVASTKYNRVGEEDYANVSQYGVLGASKTKKTVVKVNAVYNTDAVTAAATNVEAIKSLALGTDEVSTDTLNIIAGESGINLGFSWKSKVDGLGSETSYTTGYIYKSIDPKDKLGGTASDITVSLTTDNSTKGSIKASVSVDSDIDITEANLVCSLDKRAATLAHAINYADSFATGSVMYGYGDAERPAFISADEPVAEDNIGTSDYIYTYKWRYAKGTTNYNSDKPFSDEVISFTDKEFKLPLKHVVGTYLVYCEVTATRADNGASTSKEIREKMYIDKAKPDKNSITINSGDWTYGDSRHEFTYSLHYEDMEPTTLKFKKKTDADSAYSIDVPTDAGHYQVIADFAGNDNYSAVVTDPVEFKINRAKLSAPENVHMTASPTAPYGLVGWDTVVGPVENGVQLESSVSHIEVEYDVDLYRSETGEESDKELVTTVTTADTSVDFTNDIDEYGKYFVDVRAKVKPRDAEGFTGQDRNNCDDSDLSSIEVLITIGAHISSNVAASADGYSKIYDGTELTLTAEYSDAYDDPSYQWMRNGETIEGATQATHSIKYAEDTAHYSCRITSAGDSHDVVYTRTVKAAILPREITLVSASDEKVYDGTALVNHSWRIKENSGETYAGADSSLVEASTGNTVSGILMTTSITEVALNNNTVSAIDNVIGIDNLTITESGGKVVYSKAMEEGGSSNYAISIESGKLTVNKRKVLITSGSLSKIYDNKPAYSHTVTASVPYGVADGEGGLIGADAIDEDAITFAIDSVTDVHYENGNVSAVTNAFDESTIRIYNGSGADRQNRTYCYDIQTANGSLMIVPRRIDYEGASLPAGIAVQDTDKAALKPALKVGDVAASENTVEGHTVYTFAHDSANAMQTPQIAIEDISAGIRNSSGDSYVMKDGVDYDLSGDLSKNAVGSYTAVVTLKGNFAGTYSIKWAIADNEAPTGKIQIADNVWEKLVTSITTGTMIPFNTFFNKNKVIVAMSGTDEAGGSGIASMSYLIETLSESGSTYKTREQLEAIDSSGWTTVDNDVQAHNQTIANIENSMEKSVIYLKVADRAGHVTYYTTDGMVLDTVVPQISVAEGGSLEDNSTVISCEEVTLNISEANLLRITDNGEEINGTANQEGSVSITISADSSKASNIEQKHIIEVTDKASNKTTVTLKLYNGHHWGTYTKDTALTTDEDEVNGFTVMTAVCTNPSNDGCTNTCVKHEGVINWTYKYSYDDDGIHSEGIIGEEHDERSLGAKLVISRTVDGITEDVYTDYLEALYDDSTHITASNSFEQGLDLELPYYVANDSAKHYTYSYIVIPLDTIANKIVASDFKAVKDADKARHLISFAPELYAAKWEIKINGLEEELIPDSLTLKILFAEMGDEDNLSKYQIISQHADRSESSTKQDNGSESAVYTGFYPVWKHTEDNNPYYYLAKVVGATIDGNYYGLDEADYVTTLDTKSDYINKKVMKLEINNLKTNLPILYLHANDLSGDIDEILLNRNNASVSADVLKMHEPAYEGHTFKGWYTKDGSDVADKGAAVGSIADFAVFSAEHSNSLYAQWRINATLAIGDLSKTYDGTSVSPSFGTDTAKDIITNNTDITSISDGSVIIEYKKKGAADSTYTSNAPKAAGDYIVRVKVNETENYTSAASTAEFTIAPRAITIKAADAISEYGEMLPPLTAAIEAGVIAAGDNLNIRAIAYELPYTADERPDAGSKAASNTTGAGSFVIVPKCDEDANYTVTFVNGKLTVNKAVLTVTPKDIYIVRGESPVPAGAVFAGFKNADDESVIGGLQQMTLDYGGYTPETTGREFAVTYVSGLSADNYTFAAGTGHMHVYDRGDEAPDSDVKIDIVDNLSDDERRELDDEYAAQAESIAKIYNSIEVSDDEFDLTLTRNGSRIDPDEVVIIYYDSSKRPIDRPKNTGEYYVRFFTRINIGGSDEYPASEYTRFIIAPKAITIVVGDYSSTVGKELETIEYSILGIPGSDKLYGDDNLHIETHTAANKNRAGKYPITVTYDNNKNYMVTVKEGTYTVKALNSNPNNSGEGDSENASDVPSALPKPSAAPTPTPLRMPIGIRPIILPSAGSSVAGQGDGGTEESKETEPSAEKSVIIDIVGTNDEPDKPTKIDDQVTRVVSADLADMYEKLLSEDEKASYLGGENIRFRVEVRDNIVDDVIHNALLSSIEENQSIVGYLNSDFFVRVGSKQERLIEEDYESVEVTFTIPEALWRDEYAGLYSVVRIYTDADGQIRSEVVNALIDYNQITMSVDNFSNYGLIVNKAGVLERSCYWHWLILVITIIYVLILLLFMRNCKKRWRVLLLAVNLILALIVLIIGHCRLEIIFFVADCIISLLANIARKMLEEDEAQNQDQNQERS